MAKHIISISISENAVKALFGRQDKYLKLLSTSLNTSISYLNGNLTLSGDKADVILAEDIINYLTELISERELLYDDIQTVIKLARDSGIKTVHEMSKERIKVSGSIKYVTPKSFKQKMYMQSVRQKDMIFAYGPAGTGKTFLAVAMAIHFYLEKYINRIILTRPAVEAGEKLGFLPGDLADKINPYLRPLYDALHAMLDGDLASKLLERGVIEVAPLAFMRGRTLSNAFVILDEAQNTTPSQMKMFLTRLGFGSKAVITGDITQVDLPKTESSGLKDAIAKLSNLDEIAFIQLTDEDVVRHPLVTKIINAYDLTAKGK